MLDRIVYPLCCPWVPSMFSRMGVGMVASLCSIGCAIVVEVFRYNSLPSHFEINHFDAIKVFSATISVGVMVPSFFIQAIAECLTLITSKLHDKWVSYLSIGWTLVCNCYWQSWKSNTLKIQIN